MNLAELDDTSKVILAAMGAGLVLVLGAGVYVAIGVRSLSRSFSLLASATPKKLDATRGRPTSEELRAEFRTLAADGSFAKNLATTYDPNP